MLLITDLPIFYIRGTASLYAELYNTYKAPLCQGKTDPVSERSSLEIER